MAGSDEELKYLKKYLALLKDVDPRSMKLVNHDRWRRVVENNEKNLGNNGFSKKVKLIDRTAQRSAAGAAKAETAAQGA